MSREDAEYRADIIERLYELTRSDAAMCERTQFMDSLILSSLARTLRHIGDFAPHDPLDYRTRFFISEIARFADMLAIGLLGSRTAEDRLNYFRPLAFPDMRSPRTDELHAWAISAEGHIQTEHCLPDDIDTTFSALYGIRTHAWNHGLPPARICASAIRSLESVRLPTLPCLYNTWFDADSGTPDAAWRSLDIIAISSPVAFFDSIDPSHMADARSVIFDKIFSYARNPIESLWFSEFYHSLPLAIYMAARCEWPDEQKIRLRDLISETLDSSRSESRASSMHASARIRPQNDTDRWLYAAALIRLGGTADLDKIRSSHDIASDAAGDPLFIHSLKECKTTYAESPLFSSLIMFEATVCSEAVGTLSSQAATTPKRDASVPSPYDPSSLRVTDRIRRALLDFEMLKDRSGMIESLIGSVDFGICLDACMASGCLLDADHPDDPDPLLAHALGLCAYFMYDKIYDQEFHPHSLPVLFLINTVFQARIGRLIDSVTGDGISVPDDTHAILADMDISYYMLARTEPDKKCRSDAWLSLHARKSLGICLVPMLCYLRAGASPDDAARMQEFFCHFNLARQISDDAKDAEKDESAIRPKATSIRCFESQGEIECAIFSEIAAANESLRLMSSASESLARIKASLQKRLDEFLIKALKAKWELSIIRHL